MLILRYATLLDTNAIHEIHRSDIHEWKASTIDDEGVRYKRPATWEECTLLDRWEHGGAWMSPELCAIHLTASCNKAIFLLWQKWMARSSCELELYLEEDGGIWFPRQFIGLLSPRRLSRAGHRQPDDARRL